MRNVFASVFVLSFLLAFFATPVARAFARQVGLIDRPGGRKIHHRETPTGGGLVLFVAFMGPLWLTVTRMNLFFPEPERLLVGLFLGCGFIVALGMLDDLVDLPAVRKLLGQIYGALILYWAGFRIDILTNPLDPFGENPIELGPWSVLFTVLWIVSLINALNLIDGLDGLAAGVSGIVAVTLVFIGWQQGELQVMFLSLILAGSILGFFHYNSHPASIFLGDAGSMFLGYTLAAIALMGSRKSTTAIALLFPLVVGLMVPIADTLTAIIRRWWTGAPLFRGDRKHLHHRLLELGIPHRQVVRAFHLLTAYLCLNAFTFVLIPIRYAVIVIALLSLGLFLAYKVLLFLESRLLDRRTDGPAVETGPVPAVEPAVRTARWESWLERVAERTFASAWEHGRLTLVVLMVPLLFYLVATSVPLRPGMAARMAGGTVREFSLPRTVLPGEWQAGYCLPRELSLNDDTPASWYKIYNGLDKESPLLACRRDFPGGVWMPLPRGDSKAVRSFRLIRSPLFALFAHPAGVEYEPPTAMQTSGNLVLLWKRENISRDRTILPVIGQTMTRVTLQLKATGGDHFTNDLIDYCRFNGLPLFEDSYLEYYVRAGDDFPRRSGLGDIRFSVQAVIAGESGDNRPLAADQNGQPGMWDADLTAVAVNRWYFRRIPLGQYAGLTLDRLFLMFNDYPAIDRTHPVFQDGREGYLHYYFDGVAVTRGEVR